METDREINRKRKINGQDFPIPRRFPTPREENENEDEDFLSLSLSSFRQHPSLIVAPVAAGLPPPSPPPHLTTQPSDPLLSLQLFASPSATPLVIPTSAPGSSFMPAASTPPLPIPSYPIQSHSTGRSSPSIAPRVRRNSSKSLREGKSATVQPPFPWATDRRATVHSLDYLMSKQISTITGDVQCKRCERQYTIEFNLTQKFVEIGSFIAENQARMHDRAPSKWMNPTLPTCRFCEQENCAKPVISDKKKSINWLFLLLGQMLGCCTLDQLKYFCKHTKNHRTGAKDRVLYLTYLTLCKQLDSTVPFNR